MRDKSGNPMVIHNADWPVYIYALCEPGTEAVRYIGASTQPQTRFTLHVSGCLSSKSNAPKEIWLRSLRAQNLRPTLKVLEKIPLYDNWAIHEHKWIAYYRSQGANLTNVLPKPGPKRPDQQQEGSASNG